MVVRKIFENEAKIRKEEMIKKLVSNLPALRTKLRITQSDLADSIGIGRQTLLAIENKRVRMRWATFLAAVIVFSNNEATKDYMEFLGIHLQAVEKLVHNEILDKKVGASMNFEKIWTDYNSDFDTIRAICPLPVGIIGSKCPKCGSENLTGALITSNADENDPNILCKNCGYWRD